MEMPFDSFVLNQQSFNLSSKLDKFPNRSKLRAGVHFVDALPKTNSGKPMRTKVIEMAAELFAEAKQTDPVVKYFLSDIPADFQHLI